MLTYSFSLCAECCITYNTKCITLNSVQFQLVLLYISHIHNISLICVSVEMGKLELVKHF